MINTTVSTMWAGNSHVAAVVRPRKLHRAQAVYAADEAPPGWGCAAPSA